MKKSELIKKLQELKELKAAASELDNRIENLENEIKAVMVVKQVDEMAVGAYMIRWTQITSQRFDTSAFRKANEELYMKYLKTSNSRRFVVS